VKVPWDDVFAGATTLDVVTNYADSWLQTHMDALRRFLAKDGALTLALPDPVDSVCVSTLLLRYPEHATNPRALLSKVTETAKRLFRVADDLGATQRLKVVLLRAPPSYWGLRADSKLIYLSPFEFRRKERVQSPVFRIRPAADTPESEFWSKEFNFEASAGARVITKDDPALHELEGEPAARVRRITNRQSVYECAERLIKKAKRKVYDTSWGFRPPEQHRHEAHPFRKGYRAAIVTCADASEPRVSYREIIGAGYDERVERARDVLRQLADVKEHSYEPRLVSVPLDLPLLEYIVVDDCEMLLSGLGAASDEFLLIEGGALPGMISSYLERVWNSGKPIT
jgi:hypothetical protein